MLEKKENIDKILTCTTTYYSIDFHGSNILQTGQTQICIRHRIFDPIVCVIHRIHFYIVDSIDVYVTGLLDYSHVMLFQKGDTKNLRCTRDFSKKVQINGFSMTKLQSESSSPNQSCFIQLGQSLQTAQQIQCGWFYCLEV